MAREHLFRGKRTDNGEWVEGFCYEHLPPLVCFEKDNYIPEKSKWFILKTAFADWGMERGLDSFEVIPETVGQWTGLTDKNGKQAFEHDYLKDEDGNIYLIEWDNMCAGFALSQGDLSFMCCKDDISEMEVIGTIFDKEAENETE